MFVHTTFFSVSELERPARHHTKGHYQRLGSTCNRSFKSFGLILLKLFVSCSSSMFSTAFSSRTGFWSSPHTYPRRAPRTRRRSARWSRGHSWPHGIRDLGKFPPLSAPLNPNYPPPYPAGKRTQNITPSSATGASTILPHRMVRLFATRQLLLGFEKPTTNHTCQQKCASSLRPITLVQHNAK